MALFHVFSEVENRNTGVPMSGVQVRVRFTGVDTLAPIYMDEGGTPFTPSNYCITDADGMYSFYVDSGEYDLDFLVGSQVIKTIENFRPAEVGPTGPANSTYTTTSALENSDVANVSAILSESGKAGTFTIRDYPDFTAEVAADTGKVNYIRSVSDNTKVWVRTSILATGAAQTGAGSGLTVDAELAAKATLSGVARTATNNGTFTGSTIPDNVSTKAAMQALETAVENTTGNAATKANATAIGVAATDGDMGTFTGSIIPDNQTAKQGMQALETATEYAGTFVQVGSGSVIRTGQSKFTEFVSVEDKGAVGNGVTDDYAALANATSSPRYSGSVYLGSKSYNFGTKSFSSVPLEGGMTTFLGQVPAAISDGTITSAAAKWYAQYLTKAGTATGGSANEHVFAVEANIAPSSSAASYQKNGLISKIIHYDPSAGAIWRDGVAFDAQAVLPSSNTNGRIWGIHAGAWLDPSSDGLAYGAEIELYQGGVAQTDPAAANAKIALQVVALQGLASAGIKLTVGGGGTMQNAVYVANGVVASGGRYFYGGGRFVIDDAGRYGIGITPAPTDGFSFYNTTGPASTLLQVPAAGGYGAYHQFIQNGTRAASFGLETASGDVLLTGQQGLGGNVISRWNIGGGFAVTKGADITTSATLGFFYPPTVNGTPTGTPAAYAGCAPMVFDRSANKLWIYNSGWKSVTLA